MGRTTLVSSLVARLRDGGLLTLVGAPGVGKTRVGSAAAEAFAAVAWVDLAPLVTRGDVLAHVARALGLEIDAATAEEETLASLGARPLAATLVVLDNCEHVLDAVAAVVGRLLGRREGPAVLATSRVRLGLAAEDVVVVPPLDAEAAVELLLSRSQARAGAPIGPDDAVAIAQLLDGVPLALELAAARTRVLDGRALRDRLEQGVHVLRDTSRDRPERHRTLDAALEGSFQMLDPEAQRTLGGLAVFAGSFSAAAAALVLGEGLDATVDLLDALVDHSLLHVEHEADGAVRFRMFEALRQFAAARLGTAQRGAGAEIHTFRRRHALRTAEEGARLSDWSTVLDERRARQLSLEQGNLRAVLAFAGAAESEEEATACVQAAIALGSLFFARGPWSEALAVLAVTETDWFRRAPRAIRAELLWKRGFIRAKAEAYDDARADLAAAARLVEVGAARDGVLRTLATVELQRGAIAAARRHADAALSEASTRRDPVALSLALATLSEVAQGEGKLDEATRAIDEAIRIEIETLHSSVPALYRAQRASLRQEQGSLAEARGLLEEVVADVRARGLRAYLGRFLTDLGALYLEIGDAPAARRALEEARIASTTASNTAFCQIGLAILAAQSGGEVAWPTPRPGADPRLLELGAAIVEALRGARPDAAALLSAASQPTPRVRCLQRILHRLLPAHAAHSPATLRVDPQGRAYVSEDVEVDLARRPVLKRLLLALVRGHLAAPGTVVELESLVASVWPDEKLPRKTAQNRLQVAIHDLRATGLRERIESQPGGYRLDPATQVVVEPLA